MSAKIKVDLSSGALEVEGEEAFVREIYADFKTLLKEQQKKPFAAPVSRTDNGVAQHTNNSIEDSFAEETLADFFSAFGKPSFSEVETALIASAYIQKKSNLESFTGLKVNGELKQIGRVVSNITEALQGSIDANPQRIIQLKKSGSSKQAKKTYKVTHEGFKDVASMKKEGGGEETTPQP